MTVSLVPSAYQAIASAADAATRPVSVLMVHRENLVERSLRTDRRAPSSRKPTDEIFRRRRRTLPASQIEPFNPNFVQSADCGLEPSVGMHRFVCKCHIAMLSGTRSFKLIFRRALRHGVHRADQFVAIRGFAIQQGSRLRRLEVSLRLTNPFL